MKQITANDIRMIEVFHGEGLCDIDGWQSNPFTILGFAYGIGHPHVDNMQEECHDHGWNAELVLGEFFDDEDQYLEFFAKLANTIPAYNQRITSILASMGN